MDLTHFLRTIMKTPWRFLGFLIVCCIAIFTFTSYAPQAAMTFLPLLTCAIGVFVFIVSILHIITIVKNPEKYTPKFCDKCGHVLPENYVPREEKQRTLSREFEEQEDPIYIWMQANPKLARRYSGQFVAITTKEHEKPYSLIDRDKSFEALYHRANPTPNDRDFGLPYVHLNHVIGRLP